MVVFEEVVGFILEMSELWKTGDGACEVHVKLTFSGVQKPFLPEALRVKILIYMNIGTYLHIHVFIPY